jgi:asparagine synthase (glutamine-hydrolysing)
VALSGEGADELFGGYGYYRQFLSGAGMVQRWADRLRGRPVTHPAQLDRFIRNPAAVTPSGFPLLTDAVTRERLTGRAYETPDAWESDLIEWLDSATDAHKRAMAADIATWLPDDLLVKFDRMAMAHSLEGRAPYLSPRLAQLALRNNAPFARMSLSDSKLALRRVARRWLPRNILERPKQGFVLPMKAWLCRWFENHGGAESYFASRSLPDIDFQAAAKLTQDDLADGLNRERLLYALVMLAEWHGSALARIAKSIQ